MATSACSLRVLEVLVKAGAEWGARDDWGWTVHHEAAHTGSLPVIRWTFSRSSSGINTRDRLGRTPLLVALLSGVGHHAVQELLLQGADPGITDLVGRTCAEAATLYCSPSTLGMVLQHCITMKVMLDRELLLDLAGNNRDMVDTIKTNCNLVHIKQALLRWNPA